VVAEVASKIITSNEGVAPKTVYRVQSISPTSGIPTLQSEKGTQGVATVNGATGTIEVVNTFNGATGHVIGVNSVNGSTGAVTLTDLVGVNTFNGISGDVNTSTLVLHVAGISSDGGATFGGNNIDVGNTLKIGLGGTNDTLSVAVGGGINGFPLNSNETNAGGNVAIGSGALTVSTTGVRNVAVGYGSLKSSVTGDQSVAVGYGSLESSSQGGGNVAVGFVSLTNTDNTKVGAGSEGINNTAVGMCSGSELTVGSNNLCLGFNAQTSFVTADNQIVLGDSSSVLMHTVAGISAAGATFSGDIKLQNNKGIRDSDSNLVFKIVGDKYITIGDANGVSNDTYIQVRDSHNSIRLNAETVAVSHEIQHDGDNNTKIGFTTDRIDLAAGGVTFAYGVSGDFTIPTGITVSGNSTFVGGISANSGISNASGYQFSDGSIATSYTDTIGVFVDNGSSVLTTGIKGRRVIPYDCEVTEWVVTGSTSGSITWDVNWGTTSSWPNALASVGFSGNGSSPQLGATASQSYQLISTAWTKSGFSAGDIIQFEVDSVSTITDCELALKIKRTS